jgi:methylglutaconyl-CoA hydratase
MEFSRIIYTSAHNTAAITLNRPDKRNAMDDLMVKELTTAFSMAAKDPDARIVLLRANGSAFCAGADLDYLSRVASYDLEESRNDSSRLAQLYRLIYELRKPVIAIVDGPAVAGGCGLASVCDFVIASKERARFGYTEVRIGFIPAIVLVFLVKRIGEGRARELVVRGNLLSADEAREIGLVSTVVPSESLESTVTALVEELVTQNSPIAMGLCKELLAKMHGMNFMDALEFAANMNAAARMNAECKRGIAAFLKKEKIDW